MDIVVDASVILAVIVSEPQKENLVKLTRGVGLIAPHSIHWEIGNAFSSMLRRGRIQFEQALQAIEEYYQIPVRFVDVELDEALEIAAKLGIYAYDAYLIRCGLKYTAPLITLDRGLVEAAKQMGVNIVEVKT